MSADVANELVRSFFDSSSKRYLNSSYDEISSLFNGCLSEENAANVDDDDDSEKKGLEFNIINCSDLMFYPSGKDITFKMNLYYTKDDNTLDYILFLFAPKTNNGYSEDPKDMVEAIRQRIEELGVSHEYLSLAGYYIIPTANGEKWICLGDSVGKNSDCYVNFFYNN